MHEVTNKSRATKTYTRTTATSDLVARTSEPTMGAQLNK